MNSKKVVLLNYYFPPNTGVGGRRWLKLCKYLSQKNVEVTVFTPEKFILKNQPSWQNEVNHIKNLKVIEVKDSYPKILLGVPANFIEKLKYKLSDIFVDIFAKGNKYDASTFWNPIVQNQVKKYLIENKIDNLIVSGTPFNYFYFAAQLKQELPNLNLVLDFRDLWIDSMGSFGENVRKFQSKKRYELECEYEQFSIEHSNHILCASTDIHDILSSKYKTFKDKFHVINNGFDPQDVFISNDSNSSIYQSNKKSVILNIGSINCSRYFYTYFINALSEIKSINSELYHSIEFNFYGNTNLQFENDVKAANIDAIRFYGKVGTDEVKNILKAADMVLYIKREEELVNSFGSKFFEYLCARKYILILSPKGKVTEYISNNSIGFVMQKETVWNDLVKALNDFRNGVIKFNHTLDISEFSCDTISKRVNSLLK